MSVEQRAEVVLGNLWLHEGYEARTAGVHCPRVWKQQVQCGFLSLTSTPPALGPVSCVWFLPRSPGRALAVELLS